MTTTTARRQRQEQTIATFTREIEKRVERLPKARTQTERELLSSEIASLTRQRADARRFVQGSV